MQRYSQKPYLDKLSIDLVDILNWTILPVFRDLHCTVSELHEHKPQVLIGDLSDTNVLVKGSVAYLCDADSYGFGKYPARMGKQELTDPLLSKKGASPGTDWYAFTALLLKSLLRVTPYGGTYTPKMMMPLKERINKRITIFDKDIQLPECAVAPSVLPDKLIEHFRAVFGQTNKRGIFPLHLLDLRWSRCLKCAAIHARAKCPGCGTEIVEAREETQETIDAKDVFKRIFDPLGLSDAGKVTSFGVKDAGKRIIDPLGLFTRRPKKHS